jgi:PST family polysaccharide transporter
MLTIEARTMLDLRAHPRSRAFGSRRVRMLRGDDGCRHVVCVALFRGVHRTHRRVMMVLNDEDRLPHDGIFCRTSGAASSPERIRKRTNTKTRSMSHRRARHRAPGRLFRAIAPAFQNDVARRCRTLVLHARGFEGSIRVRNGDCRSMNDALSESMLREYFRAHADVPNNEAVTVSLARRAVRGALWTLLENTSSQLSSFVLFLVFARLIDAKAIGLVQVAITLFSFLTIFVEHGFTTTVIRNRDIGRTGLNTAFWMSLGGGTVLAVAISLLAPQIAAAYRIPELTPVLRVIAWCVPITSLGVIQSAVLTRELAFRAQAIRRLFAVAGGGVVGLVLAFRGFGAWALVARFVVETAVYSAIAWMWSPWNPGTRVSRRDAREFTSFASRVAGAYLISFFNRRIDDLVVGLVLGPTILGYFAVATRGVLLVTEVALRAVQRTAMPIFARLQDEPDRLREAYYEAVALAVALASPIFIGMAAVASELCVVMFGAKWAPVIPAMSVLGFSGIAVAVSAFNMPVLIATGRPAWLFYLSIVEAVVSIASSILAARFGLLAVAFAYVVRSYLLVPLGLLLVRRSLGVSIARVARSVYAPAVASAVMVGVVLLLRPALASHGPALRLVVLVVASAATYVMVMALTARSTVERLIELARGARAPAPPLPAPAGE